MAWMSAKVARSVVAAAAVAGSVVTADSVAATSSGVTTGSSPVSSSPASESPVPESPVSEGPVPEVPAPDRSDRPPATAARSGRSSARSASCDRGRPGGGPDRSPPGPRPRANMSATLPGPRSGSPSRSIPFTIPSCARETESLAQICIRSRPATRAGPTARPPGSATARTGAGPDRPADLGAGVETEREAGAAEVLAELGEPDALAHDLRRATGLLQRLLHDRLHLEHHVAAEHHGVVGGAGEAEPVEVDQIGRRPVRVAHARLFRHRGQIAGHQLRADAQRTVGAHVHRGLWAVEREEAQHAGLVGGQLVEDAVVGRVHVLGEVDIRRAG